MLNGKMLFAFALLLFWLRGSLACFRVDSYETVYIETGTGFSKECQCEEDGFTIKDLKWLGPHDDEIGRSGPGPATTQEIENGLNIDITSMSKTLSGQYKCVTTDDSGQSFSQIYNLHVFDPLVFINSKEDQYLIEDTDSMLFCEVIADASPMYTWYRELDDNSEFQIHENDKFKFMPQGLLIKNVITDDSGTYKCRVNVMSTGEDVDRSIAVQVMTAPKIIRISANPTESLVAGEKLTLVCMADSTPFPEYSWNKTSETTSVTHKSWYQVENTIVFDTIKAEDSGTYECYAYNPAGGVKKEITVEVLAPPVILNFTNVTAVEDEIVNLTCNAEGFPMPNVTIMFYGKELEEDGTELPEVEIIRSNTTIRVSRNDEGYYICNASNRVDFVTAEMYLTVYHKPYFDQPFETIWGWDGHTVKLSCVHESNPRAEIKWRYQDNDILTSPETEINRGLIEKMNVYQDVERLLTIDNVSYYGSYECTAQNNFGQAKKVIHLKEMFPPMPVKNASLLEVTATSATFSIEGQSDEGKNMRITGYTAEYDTEDKYLVTYIHKNRTWSIDRPFKLENLQPNTAYKVSFVAVNEVGSSKKTGDLLLFHTLNTTVPDPPVWELDALELFLNDSQVLKWEEPESNGAPIDYYILRYCPAHDESLCKEIKSVKPEIGLDDLDDNTTYFLELVAHNAEGNSLAVNATIKTLALTVTGAPPVFMSGGVLIGISIVVVIICILLLDLLFFFWRRQGILANCCLKKNKTNTADAVQARDKKGLLKDNGESCDALRPANGHKEFEYNKNTGVITGKHSAV